MLVYLYDEAGTPIGLKYRNSSYAEKVYDCYFFEKNIFGDVVAIYDENGVMVRFSTIIQTKRTRG